jgi:hypothetical protein
MLAELPSIHTPEFQPKSASLARSRSHTDTPAHALDRLAHNRQPVSRTFLQPRPGVAPQPFRRLTDTRSMAYAHV